MVITAFHNKKTSISHHHCELTTDLILQFIGYSVNQISTAFYHIREKYKCWSKQTIENN